MHLWKESIWHKYSIALYNLLFMFNKWYVKWLSISYHYSLFTILFKWFIFLIVYLFTIYLTHWKSITYRETIDCFFCFSCLRPFCENTWMTAFANFDLVAFLRECLNDGLCEFWFGGLFANFDLAAICENDFVAICENDLKPKNFSAYGHSSIYYI